MPTREAAPDGPSPSPTAFDTIGGAAPVAQPAGGDGAPGGGAIAAIPVRERRLADLLRTIFALPAGGTGLLGLSRVLERAAVQTGHLELQATASLVATRLQSRISVESDRARVRALAGARAAKAFLHLTAADSAGDGGTPIGRALAGVLLYAVEHQVSLHGYGHQLASLVTPHKPLASKLERAIRGRAQELQEFAAAREIPGDWRRLASLFHKARTWAPCTPPAETPPAALRPARRDRTALQVKLQLSVDGSVYTNGGSYGGMLSFRVADGTLNWFNGSLLQFDQWTPAVDATHAYAFIGGRFFALDRVSGATIYSIVDANWSFGGYQQMSTPILAGAGTVIGINSRPLSGPVRPVHLINFDTVNRSIRWSLAGTFVSEPAVAKGVIYVANGTQLEARSQADGSLLWSWTPNERNAEPFGNGSQPSNVIVTDNLLFVSTVSSTYAIDLARRNVVWSFPRGGQLALSRSGILYIAPRVGVPGVEPGTLTAINLN